MTELNYLDITKASDGHIKVPSIGLTASAITESIAKTALASFADGAGGFPFRVLTGYINPVQNLNGQSAPYPAGGGKNKCDTEAMVAGVLDNSGLISAANVSVTAKTANSISWTGSATWKGVSTDFIPVTAGDSLFISLTETVSYVIYAWYDSSKAFISKASYNGGSLQSITVPNGASYVRYTLQESAAGSYTYHNIQVEKGSTATAYAPYSNICPITGWTAMNVVRMGKNLCPTATITLGNGSPRTKDIYFTKPLPIGTYTFSASVTTNTAASNNPGVQFFTSTSSAGSATMPLGTTGTITKTITVTEPLLRMYFYIGTTDYNNGKTIVFENIQVEVGSTATTYEPYTGTTYPISWSDEAGTVYGGYVNPVTGVLTVTDGNIASYNGETLPSTWISDRDVYAAGTTPTTGAQVVYELATPQTYQLTPTEVLSVLGTNNVWVDTNGDVECTYIADTKLYIDAQIAAL